MTPRLALTHSIRAEAERAPVEYRDNAETFAKLEAADARERLLTCDDAEAERLYRRWLAAYVIS